MKLNYKRISISKEQIFLLHKKKYEIFLSDKFNMPIMLEIMDDDRLGYSPQSVCLIAAINSKKYILPKLLKRDLSYCRLELDQKENVMRVAYMKTMLGKRKNSWQNYLQAMLCDVFDIKKVVFEDVLPKGKKYLSESSLYQIAEVINDRGIIDICCSVNKQYLQTLFAE
jgi:hypothetical protein